jgi:zinc ribbon protein
MPFVVCPNCSHTISDAARTCPNCGHTLPARPAPPAVTYVSPTEFSEPHVPAAVQLPYFEVSLRKFVVMSIVTWGMYILYWTYRQWILIEARTREGLSPIWRTIFSPLWNFSLFDRVKADAERRHLTVGWSGGLLAVIYLLAGALWRLPDPWWLVSLLAFLPLIPVVRTIGQLHNTLNTDRKRNDRFTRGNIIGIVIGVLFLLLVVLTLIVPPTPP